MANEEIVAARRISGFGPRMLRTLRDRQ